VFFDLLPAHLHGISHELVIGALIDDEDDALERH